MHFYACICAHAHCVHSWRCFKCACDCNDRFPLLLIRHHLICWLRLQGNYLHKLTSTLTYFEKGVVSDVEAVHWLAVPLLTLSSRTGSLAWETRAKGQQHWGTAPPSGCGEHRPPPGSFSFRCEQRPLKQIRGRRRGWGTSPLLDTPSFPATNH